MQAELQALEAALGKPARPVTAVVGGAKVSTKLDLLGNLVGKVDFGSILVTSVTGFEWNKRDVALNLDGNPYIGLEPVLGNEASQVTQELRIEQFFPADDATDQWIRRLGEAPAHGVGSTTK